jgi:plasmid stabilization system protein ParE
MPRLSWSPAAVRDVARLHEFLAPKSRDAAQRAVKTIRRGVKALGKHPEIGRPIEELPPEFREWAIEFGSGAYVALYHYDGKEAVILAVRHVLCGAVWQPAAEWYSAWAGAPRPQDTILPHIRQRTRLNQYRCSVVGKVCGIGLSTGGGICTRPTRPIENRPQVENLPHKFCSISCLEKYAALG